MIVEVNFKRLVSLIVTAALAFGFSDVSASAEQTAAQIVANVKPAVVFIVGATQSGAKSGSGFVLRSNATSSVIVTAEHVVEGTTEVDVIFDSDETKRFPATVVQRDHIKDIALLKVDQGNRPSLKLEPTNAFSEGAAVLIIGYPRASLQFFRRLEGDTLRPSVHSGIVSAIRLNGEVVQFDAAVDHGDSGAPIIDESNGKVIAIVRGTPLDPSYASRGIEQALPGSAYGPSSDVIALDAGSADVGRTSDQSGAFQTGTANLPPGGANSASYRLGYGIPQNEGPMNDEAFAINSAVDNSVLDRLVQFLKGDNSLYLIPLQLSPDALSDSQHLAGYCDDNRLNAIASPSFKWQLTGSPLYNAYGVIVRYSGTASVTMTLFVFDCFGEPFFAETKTKSENRYFAHRTPDREVVDMANDLLDQMTADLSKVESERQAQWQSLLKTGLAWS